MKEYERKKEASRAREAEQSRAGRDIGPLPQIASVEVVESCERNLRLFCETFFPDTFFLAWSDDHLEAIRTLESVVLDGGQFALAMPRGSGKTSLVIAALLWAICYGHRLFLVAIAATGPKAQGILDAIKAQVETNDKLAEHYPAVCYPVRRLEGVNNRAAGQTLGGERTRISWTSKRLEFPTIAGARSSGVVLHTAGLLGSYRGAQHTRADGQTVRPDFCALDDPQTDESAENIEQTRKRMRVIDKAVLNLAGPTSKIAVVCPCTVIQPGDLADLLLDREGYPEWRGRKFALLKSMPNSEAMKLWERYREVRKDSLRETETIASATKFYADNREAMEAGAVVAWPQRYETDHVSALQYAMDKWAKSESSFWAEYQNAPRLDESADLATLRVGDFAKCYDGSARGDVPDWTAKLTAFIDIQQDILPYAVLAWSADMQRAHFVEYGAYPPQSKRYYTLRNCSPTLREATGEQAVESAIERGLHALCEQLQERYPQLVWIGQDANWNLSTEIVYATCRKFQKCMPFHGRFVGAASKPMAGWKRKAGERAGHFWRLALEPPNNTRVVNCDINAWKSIILQLVKGGGLTIHGNRAHLHEMLVDQLCAEYAVRVTGRGRRVSEWKNRPGRDNHLWDCLVGAAVGASISGATIAGAAPAPKVNRLKGSEIQRRRRLGQL